MWKVGLNSLLAKLRKLPLDVDRWLKPNALALGSTAEVMRIVEVVHCMKTKPQPRLETVKQFFKPWSEQQRIKNDRRPLPELLE